MVVICLLLLGFMLASQRCSYYNSINFSKIECFESFSVNIKYELTFYINTTFNQTTLFSSKCLQNQRSITKIKNMESERYEHAYSSSSTRDKQTKDNLG